MGPNHRLGRSSTSKRTRYRIHLGRLHINRKMCRNPAGEECASVPSADISHWPLPVCLSCLPKRLSGLQLSIKHPIPVSPRPRKARPPPGGATRRRRPPERAARPKTQMCMKRGETAQQKIVLASGRGGAYYSILRQARKREGRKPRGRPPQAGTLRTGYWTRDDHNSQ